MVGNNVWGQWFQRFCAREFLWGLLFIMGETKLGHRLLLRLVQAWENERGPGKESSSHLLLRMLAKCASDRINLPDNDSDRKPSPGDEGSQTQCRPTVTMNLFKILQARLRTFDRWLSKDSFPLRFLIMAPVNTGSNWGAPEPGLQERYLSKGKADFFWGHCFAAFPGLTSPRLLFHEWFGPVLCLNKILEQNQSNGLMFSGEWTVKRNSHIIYISRNGSSDDYP